MTAGPTSARRLGRALAFTLALTALFWAPMLAAGASGPSWTQAWLAFISNEGATGSNGSATLEESWTGAGRLDLRNVGLKPHTP